MATTPAKDTIYVDIDDEITGIIDKVRSSSGKVVALVLPKRAAVLQSVVNMKLLKRSSEEAKKNIVLITSEAGLMPLAATVGLHVAKTPLSKPEIPALADEDAEGVGPEETVNLEGGDDDEEEITTATAGDKPIGDLAAKAGDVAALEEVETLNLDSDTDEPGADSDDETPAAASTKNKRLRIPDFNKFRLGLIVGAVVLVLLIVGFVVANSVLPKATVTLTTDTSSVSTNLTMTLDSTAKSVNLTTLTVPAQLKTVQKSQSQQVATTGQQNNGQKATGDVTMTAEKCSGNPFVDPSPVPAGTGITENGLTYVTQNSATFTGTGASGGCYTYSAGTNNIAITAQTGGTKYNVSSATFSVDGRSDVSASGSASGGTDDIIQTVAQADIDSATQKIAAQDTTAINQQLEQQLQQAGLVAVGVTFATGTPTTTTSANVGDQATTVTVTQAISYTMLGVKQSDLKTVVDNYVKGQINPTKQAILDEGLSGATFRLANATATSAQVQFSTTATAGPNLQVATLRSQVAGLKSGDIQTLLETDPGVTKVAVHFSPFWVNVAPKKTSKITIVFVKSSSTAKSNASSQ